MASASGYNHHRFSRTLLKKSRKFEPSLVVQLNDKYWRFADSPINFTYDGPMRPFLLALRAQVIPASLIPFLYDIDPPVSFFDGCIVVEVQDFRKSPDVRTRVVMRPAAESLAQSIDVMLERRGVPWNEQLALELESTIIAATSAPLYLGTNILATRNAVLALGLTTPALPNMAADGTFRSPTALTDEPTSSSERMRKLLRAGERSVPFQPSWSILRHKERMENMQRQRERDQAARAAMPAPEQLAMGGNQVNGGSGAEGEPKKKKKKRPAPEGPEASKEGKKKKTAAAGPGGTAAQEESPEGKKKSKAEGGEEKPKPKKKKRKAEEGAA